MPPATTTALTATERDICRLCGLTEAAFLATRQAEASQPPHTPLSARASALTAQERDICHRCGLTEAAFLAAKHAN